MSEHSFLRKRWKLVLNVVTVIALVILIVAIHSQLIATFKDLDRVNAWLLLLLIPVQILDYHAQAKLYQRLFAVVGNKLKYWFLFKASLELNFVNHVFPSGGVSGISYFGVRLRNKEITGGKATMVHIMKVILSILSFELFLIVGLLFLAFGNRANDLVILITSSLTTLLLVGSFAFFMIIGSQRRITATFTFATRLINKIVHIFLLHSPDIINLERAERAFEEVHNNYKLLQTNWRELKWPFVWATTGNFAEIATIYIVYLAFGKWVNVGAIILAYAVANFAGLISVLPGGVGVYEAIMTAVLVAAGIPAAISLPVTVMYRVLNTLIQVPPGYILYNRTLHRPPSQSEVSS